MQDNSLVPHKVIKQCGLLSAVLALALVFTSLGGILRPEVLYPDQAARAAFLPNDIINLALGVPALLLLMGQAGRGRPIAQLIWPGAALFVSYNALAYCVALSTSPFFLLYLAELVLSLLIVFLLLRALDAQTVMECAGGMIYEKWAGWVLLVLGLLILIRNLGVVTSSAGLQASEIGVLAADLLSIVAWLSAGFLLVKRRAGGYRLGPAALFQASLLFLSLLVVMAIQPAFGAGPYTVVDFAVIALMSLVCWVPFGLQLRTLRRNLAAQA